MASNDSPNTLALRISTHLHELRDDSSLNSEEFGRLYSELNQIIDSHAQINTYEQNRSYRKELERFERGNLSDVFLGLKEGYIF